MRFLTVGSVAIDTIETESEKRERIIGGSANYSAAAALHFVQPLIVGIVGDDYPRAWLDRLAQRGVDVTGIERARGESFFWHGRYSRDFSTRTSLATNLGVFENFRPVLPEKFRTAEFIFLGNIKPELQKLVLDQVSSPVFVAMDTMNCWIDRSCGEVIDLVGKVDCVLINDEELEALTGRSSPTAGLREMQRMGARTVVVKLGKWGSILLHQDGFFWSPAFPLERIVDPTGAGDSFAGAFLGCLAAYGCRAPRDFKRAMLYASAMASFAVEGFEPGALLDVEWHRVVERFQFLRNFINY
jgi:sugar/nucleoside kinase (ribokinase family)